MSTFEPWEAKLAWQIALQVRGCPPDSVLQGEGDQELSTHLSQCPFCSEIQRPAKESADETGLAREIVRHASPPPLCEPSPGVLCRVSRNYAGWGPKGRHYNPPLLLVLEEVPDMPGVLTVAPLYDDLRLAGPGDVMLGDGLFAESWNTFPVGAADLEFCHGSVEEAQLQEVLSARGVDWEAPPEGTPLEAFRRLEVEVAAFFALQALPGLMGRRELGALEELAELFPDDVSLRAALADDYPDVEWPDHPMAPAALLAHARLGKTGLAMAAAGDAELKSANVVVIGDDGIALQSTLFEIRHISFRDNGLVVGGRVLSLQAGRVELHAQWVKEGCAPVECDQSFIDGATGFFRILFRSMTEDQFRSGRLLLLVAVSAQP